RVEIDIQVMGKRRRQVVGHADSGHGLVGKKDAYGGWIRAQVPAKCFALSALADQLHVIR
ncbi:hypothetical protein, partial [Pseudomonas viridiflava]|uniref:hypothetical protein n=1 Tax=Pseudomonas viridiflava TaxID=33069 RepID=UPI001981A0C6